jgi:hypothetical protein
LPKKIKVDLLPADLAFQLGNPLARLLDLSWRLFRRRLMLGLLFGRPLPRKASGPPARKRVRQ